MENNHVKSVIKLIKKRYVLPFKEFLVLINEILTNKEEIYGNKLIFYHTNRYCNSSMFDTFCCGHKITKDKHNLNLHQFRADDLNQFRKCTTKYFNSKPKSCN